MQTVHKKALIMLKTGLNVTRGDFDREGNFFRFALARISVFVPTMSEQPATPPPALRLKPRLRPADGQAPADAPAGSDLTSFPPPPPAISTGVPVSAEVAEVPSAPKIRFKPKMAVNPAELGDAPAVPAAAAPAPSVSDPAPAMIQPPTMANPHVTAPGPVPIATPAPSPLFVSDPVPATPAAASPTIPPTPAAAPVDPNKFKLKPKVPSLVPPPVPPASAPPPLVAGPPVAPTPPPRAFGPPGSSAPPIPLQKAPPPFPVVAPPVGLKIAPPSSVPPPVVPATSAPKAAGEAGSRPPVVIAPRKSSKLPLVGLAALILLGAGYFGWKYLLPAKSATAPTPTVKSSPPTPAAVPPSDPSPTPSETLNKLAHAPANAINQAQEAIATRRASGQARIDAASIGEDLPDRPATSADSGKAGGRAPATTTTTIAPNVTATTAMEAAPEATAPFRSFVANAKVSGVFQGTPSRAVINGKLTRAGDVVEPGLGITFTGIDSDRRHLVFKDRTGATVSRRF
jgi:hypothetical protein